jgi:FAD binding domain
MATLATDRLGDALRTRTSAEIFTPDDHDWDVVRTPWNLAVDQRPAAVARVSSALEIQEVVRFAGENGFRVAPQGTGHASRPMGSLENTILLKTSLMRRVQIDPARRLARVEPGVTWMEVVDAAADHGLATLAGSSPDVGVVGYTLGGGMSWLARKHGLAANSVVAAELVTGGGHLLRVDAEHHSDLFWAIRGGGGSFGVVTALEFSLFPLREVYAGILWWPIERATEVLDAWRKLAEAGLPDETVTCGRLLQLPPIAEIPEPVRGRSFVVVEIVHAGTEREGEGLIAPLRALAPEIDDVRTMPVRELQHLHLDPEHPAPGVGDGVVLAALPPEAVAAVVDATIGSPLVSVEIRQLGGALGRSDPGHGALDAFDGSYAMFALGIAPTPETAAAADLAATTICKALAPWTAAHTYMNFSETRRDPRTFWSHGVYERLAGIREAVDPGRVIRANHPLD